MSIAVIIQHAVRMRLIMLSSMGCRAVPYFFNFIAKAARFKQKKLLNLNFVFDFLDNVCLNISLSKNITERDIKLGFHVKYSLFSSYFNKTHILD